MSQLNLQQILSADTLSELVDKINYNFDQIVLNGGGPQGLRGIIGAPGLPGSQGEQGVTGSTGPDGTYLYASDLDPNTYSFGASGEPLPRPDDVFLEAQPTYIGVWKLDDLGTWNLVETVQAPVGGLSKVVYDAVSLGANPDQDSASNDPAVVGRFLFGSEQALSTSDKIIDPAYPISSASPQKVIELSSASLYGDSLATLASTQNQLRLISSSDNVDWTNRLSTGGGVVHSMEVYLGSVAGAVGLTHQIYNIKHADFIGGKHFSVNLSSTSGTNPTLLYADDGNRALFGGSLWSNLAATLNANNSLAVGANNFYTGISRTSGATFSFMSSRGAMIQGNLSVGRNSNKLATIAALTDDSLPGGQQPAEYPDNRYVTRILADVNRSTASSQTNRSEIMLSVNFAKQYLDNQIGSNGANIWRIQHNAQFSNSLYRSLYFWNSMSDLVSGTVTAFAGMYLGVTGSASSSPLSALTLGIHNTDPRSLLEIGRTYNRISVGESWGTGGSAGVSYIGFNLHRSPLSNGSWIRRAGGTATPLAGGTGPNAGSAIFTTTRDSGLYFSFMESTGSGATVTATDNDVYTSTRTVLRNGYIKTAEGAQPQLEFGPTVGLYVGIGVSGTTGTGYTTASFRRYAAVFGKGFTVSNLVTPTIFVTNGLAGSTSGPSFPQYSFLENSTTGLYYSQGSVFSGITGSIFGLSNYGNPGVSINYNSVLLAGYQNQPLQVGILQAAPMDTVHLGEKLFIHMSGFYSNSNSNSNPDFISSNMYRNGSTLTRAVQTNGAWRGASRIVFDDTCTIGSGFSATGATGFNSVNRFTSIGSKLRFDVATIGPTSNTYDINNWSIGYTQRSVVIQPPPIGPTALSGTAYYSFQTQVPQMTIGLKNNADRYSDNDPSGNTAKRGTLALAAQMRVKPSSTQFLQTTIEDMYNIGFYGYDGYPVAGIYASGNPQTMVNKTFGFSMLGDDGDAVSQDASLLEFKVDAGSMDDASGSLLKRIANFGPGVRVGMGPDTSTAFLLTEPVTDTYDVATLTVGAIEVGTGANDRVAALFKGGSVVIDLSENNNQGGNMGLIFKDASMNSVFYGNLPTEPSGYRMDWGIQYNTAVGPTGNRSWGGLNFGKAADTPSQFGFTNYMLWISDNGNVGINTGAPVAKLHVNGGSPYGANAGGNVGPSSPLYWFSGTMGQNTLANNNVWGSSRTLSIRASNDVWANLFIASSDLRIKDVVKVSDGYEDLEAIKKIQVTDYRYKDVVSNGDQVHKKLIAQNVKDALPNAVTTSTDFIPNIYQITEEVTHSDGLTTVKIADLKDLREGDKIKLIPEDDQTPITAEILSVDNDASCFTFKSGREHEKFFVYGKEIDDFQMVDYDSVFSMHISATQQLCKIVDEKDAQIKKLEERLSKIEELLSKNNIL